MKKLIASSAVASVLMTATPAMAYEVKKGDTLSEIAYDHDMRLNTIVELNPQIENIHLIYPGDTVNTNENEVVQSPVEYQTSTTIIENNNTYQEQQQTQQVQEPVQQVQQQETQQVQNTEPVVEEVTEQQSEPVYTATNGVSESDKDLLARLVRAEAQSEPFDGKVAVATVVLNRVNSSQFPNTIPGVIYQTNQFSPVSNGSINKAADSESIRATETAIQMGGSSDGALFFYNPSIATSRWLDSRQTVKVIGNHVFKK
jgi:N-acetylmuramoyl-L-alanine amidase